MTIRDLLQKDMDYFGFKDSRLKSDLIAMDSGTGKIIFDTSRNKREFIEKYYDSEVRSIWADVKLINGYSFGDHFKAVVKCYISQPK